MEAVKPFRLDPCPAEERVSEFAGITDVDAIKVSSQSEEMILAEDGITRQKCGGGHRIIRKRIGGS